MKDGVSLGKIDMMYKYMYMYMYMYIFLFYLGPLLLTWINLNDSICPVKCGMKLLIHSKLQRFHSWGLGMDK